MIESILLFAFLVAAACIIASKIMADVPMEAAEAVARRLKPEFDEIGSELRQLRAIVLELENTVKPRKPRPDWTQGAGYVELDD